MLESRKIARNFLKTATLKDYKKILREAKVTEIQIKILYLKIFKNKHVFQIANRLHVAPETIKYNLTQIYDAVSKVLKQK